MMQLINSSTEEDLRDPSWELLEYKREGDTLTTTHKDVKNNEVYVAKTRFATYEDAFGNPVILHQDLYKESGD